MARVQAAATAFLFGLMLQRAWSLLYVLNFRASGPGPWLLAALLLCTSVWFARGPATRVGVRRMRWLASAAACASLVSWGPIALPAALLACILLSMEWSRLEPHHRPAALTLGIAGLAALAVWTPGAPAPATNVGALIIVLAAAVRLLPQPAGGPPRPDGLGLVLLWLAAWFAALPPVVAAWHGLDATPFAVALLFGVLAPVPARELRLSQTNRVWPLVAAAVSTWMVLVVSGFAWTLAAWLWSMRSLHVLRPVTRAGLPEAILLIALLGHAAAPAWSFMPPWMQPALKGMHVPMLVAGGVAATLAAACRPSMTTMAQHLAGARHGHRASRPVVVALAFLTVAGTLVPPATIGPDDDTFRVVTYNVHQGWDGGPPGDWGLDETLRVLRGLEPDIVGLQEVETSRVTSGQVDGVQFLADRLGMHSVRDGAAKEGYLGNALLSRWPILEHTTYVLPSGDRIERTLLHAVVEHPDGPLDVYVTHLATTDNHEARLLQFRAIDALMDGPALLLGDMNMPVPQCALPPSEYVGRCPEVLFPSWRYQGLCRRPCPSTFPAADPHLPIDHIIGYAPIGFQWYLDRSWTAGTAAASDHEAVFSDIKWGVWNGESCDRRLCL